MHRNGDSTLRVLGLCKAVPCRVAADMLLEAAVGLQAAQADLMDPAHGSRIAALEKDGTSSSGSKNSKQVVYSACLLPSCMPRVLGGRL